MAGEPEAFSVLTLLLAVCEHAMSCLDELDPPCERKLTEEVASLRGTIETFISPGSPSAARFGLPA